MSISPNPETLPPNGKAYAHADALMINPYHFPAGPMLDTLIHNQLIKAADTVAAKPYSTSESAAAELRCKLESLWGYRIVVGRSGIRQKPWFARCESDPSTSIEVLAETRPLAVARITVLYLSKYQ